MHDLSSIPGNLPGSAVIYTLDLTEVETTDLVGAAIDPEVAAAVAASLTQTGCLLVRDPRVGSSDNAEFLDMMERYFSQTAEAKRTEERAECHHQVGVTPEGTERPRCLEDAALQQRMRSLPQEHRANTPTGADVKWRYLWRLLEAPATRYSELCAAPNVSPATGFPEWADVMDSWGGKLVAATTSAAAYAAVGLGLQAADFTDMLNGAPHLLAPTGVDLEKFGSVGTTFAGYHYDMNFLTAHGKSRFPALHVWLRDGRRVPVAVPDDCLLLQAGKQMEYLTGGHVQAGFHEVVCTDSTVAAAEAARAAGRMLWRVSSTCFLHAAYDRVLKPLGPYSTPETREQYPEIETGAFVQRELQVIALSAAKGYC